MSGGNYERLLREFHEGTCRNAPDLFGAHFSYEGSQGVRFTVFAPHARQVTVFGSFNDWNDGEYVMERTQDPEVFSLFVPGVQEWDSYKYHILSNRGWAMDKADPYAFYSETPPANASKVYNLHDYAWHDQSWMLKRNNNEDAPVSIYEVHAGGWRHDPQDHPYTYTRLKDELLPYVSSMGFTHIELMPVTEYPYDGSWGYQTTGYYSVTSRYGNPYEFCEFIDACHQRGIGVILDFVPAHFARDSYGLASFDGQALYEYSRYEDAKSPWGTLNFNFARGEVRSFLLSAALFWCRTYHMDGIRFDAVSNLVYWNGDGRRGVNTAAIEWVQQVNSALAEEFPSVMKIAEDSTTYPGVTKKTADGGLGFDYKWDLGWMNDTLRYFSMAPKYRISQEGILTFSMNYFSSEHFLLPLSHDENVHGKKTILDRMYGSYEDKFAQVRLLYAYMFAHPGKKLNFMGNELGSFREFDEKRQLDWNLLSYPLHDALHHYFQNLNMLARSVPVLYQNEYDSSSFTWVDVHAAVFVFARHAGKQWLVCALNAGTQSFPVYDLYLPFAGRGKEILNSDAVVWGGSGMVNDGAFSTGKKNRITIRLGRFAAVWLLFDAK